MSLRSGNGRDGALRHPPYGVRRQTVATTALLSARRAPLNPKPLRSATALHGAAVGRRVRCTATWRLGNALQHCLCAYCPIGCRNRGMLNCASWHQTCGSLSHESASKNERSVVKTEFRVPVCLLVALQTLALQAVAQQTEGGLSNCPSWNNINRSIFEPSIEPSNAPAPSNPGPGGPSFGDYSFSASKASFLGRSLREQFPQGLRLEYAGTTVVSNENLGTFRGVSVQLRYVDGYPDFDTDPMRNSPQDVEIRKRCARRVLLFGGNTFFYSAKEGTGLFLGQKKRSCLLFGASHNGLQARLAFGF